MDDEVIDTTNSEFAAQFQGFIGTPGELRTQRNARIIMLRGLPGSGKTTYAKQYIIDHPGTVIVSKDALRTMLHNGYHSKRREKFVRRVRDAIIVQALSDGHDIIVDDTNFHEMHRKRIEEIAGRHGAIVEVKEFNVDVEICVERDRTRENCVGDKVIRDMARQYVAAKPPKIERDPTLLDVVISDLDGTLALFGSANPYDRDFTKDEVNDVVKDALWQYRQDGASTVLFSGRKEKYREQTEIWLRCNDINYERLCMRRDDDNRKDAIVKEEFYNQHIRGKYNVRALFDDRLSVCRLWWSLGLPLFRVGDPDSDF